MVSIKDIAQKAGVSISTVSRTLNNYTDVNPKTKEKIFRIAKELNYYPNAVARSLVQKKTNTIGVFFGNKINSGFDHPFFQDVISAVREVVGNAGYDMLIFTNQKRERGTYTTLSRERSVDGIVLLLTGEGKKRDEHMLELQESGIPCTAIDIPLSGVKCGYVESDNFNGTRAAVEHLISLGHTGIAFIGGDEISKTSYDRLRGYQQALMDHKIGFDPSLITLGYFEKSRAAEETRKLMERGKQITAFIAASDEMAIAAMQTLNEMGYRVPEDVSVIGFDDIREAVYAQPALTTVRQEKYKLGTVAAEVLLNLIDGKDPICQHVVLPCELIVRKSTAICKKS
ncbi:LacI family DNA-binding transcriptional regulator [Paenibacillus gansuensis]|uniref:LacI family DNA-binding transcriptional regulator n=1 Tax=Paenibacillus gansuensis TaxID=306542 RepID=A0ABW5PBI1_9BACL